LEQSPVPLATAIEAPAGALPAATPPAVPATTDARGALARLLEGMVAQNPTAAELQRVITVLQGAPEARIAQAILDAMAQATSAAVSDAGSADVLGQAHWHHRQGAARSWRVRLLRPWLLPAWWCLARRYPASTSPRRVARFQIF
jgi:hypothetical protein